MKCNIERIKRVLANNGRTLDCLATLTEQEARQMKNFPLSFFEEKEEVLSVISAPAAVLPADWKEQLEAAGYRFEIVTERVEGGKWIFESACKVEYRNTGARSYNYYKRIASSKVGFGDYHTADEFEWIKLAEDQLKGQFVRYEEEDSFQVALWSGEVI